MLKPALTTSQHIALLRQRGMVVDSAQAEQWLNSVGYYRLSAYWYPARQVDPSPTGRRLDQFVPGTDFANVAELYEADRKLRTLVHDGMERIEVAVRTQVVEILCAQHPSNPAFYLSSDSFRTKFAHLQWLQTAYSRLARAGSKSDSVKHHAKHYSGMFPFWAVAEVLDFRDVSVLYSGLKSRDQRAVAENLDIFIDFNVLSDNQKSQVQKSHPSASWLEQLVLIRNVCAHHSRLWNRTFNPASTSFIRTNGNLSLLPPGQNERLFGALQLMSHILRKVAPGTTWPLKILDLVNNAFLPNPLVSPPSLGIPASWDARTI